MAITISGDTPNFSAATITALTSTTGTVTTLNAPSGVLATQNGMTGIPKAWAQFNGASGTVNGSFNVSSVTRASAGQYTVTMTTAMANANYSVNVSASPNAAGTVNAGIYVIFTSGGGALAAPTTSSFQFVCYTPSATNLDPNYVCVSVFGS
jgi:hypothetical protein